ncbi:uncharacterized protein C8A04DRAFT_39958 [Dichotomopilus funicola]|uniref:CENP-V/GFA domain-containing protein n=1 Tax=Dichotomopilus funicola TaxID=1934379 RepID=A0AAN6ZID9_9PEZI|nr:hypothetical protein C8A04DRAFT_39958 [Dichotomopilus funicola]
MSTPRTYRGNCHCGAFVYEVDTPDGKDITSASECSCSICYKRAYLWLVPKTPVRVVKDEGLLVGYGFAGRNLDHQFCGKCGTTVIAKSAMFPAGMGINVRTIQGLDIWGLEIKPFNGDTFEPKYVAPTFTGEDPAPADFEKDGKTYHGSCHCGAVTTSVRVHGSLEDGTYPDRIMECNCSFCRLGSVWIYPTTSQFALTGRDNLTYYTFGNRIWQKLFCKTCGVQVGSEVRPDMSEAEVAALPEAYQQHRAKHIDTVPLNLRVLNGFSVKQVEAQRGDGWGLQMPQYVYP